VVGVEDHGVLSLPNDQENDDARGVGSHSGESREQCPKSLGSVSRTGGQCLSWKQTRPELPQAGAHHKHVVLVLRCVPTEGVVRGVEDTVVMERVSGACSAVTKDPEEHFDLLWCKAISVHL
jgi:hypothetical protein